MVATAAGGDNGQVALGSRSFNLLALVAEEDVPVTEPVKIPTMLAPANPICLVAALIIAVLSKANTLPVCTPEEFPVTLPTRLPVCVVAKTLFHRKSEVPSV